MNDIIFLDLESMSKYIGSDIKETIQMKKNLVELMKECQMNDKVYLTEIFNKLRNREWSPKYFRMMNYIEAFNSDKCIEGVSNIEDIANTISHNAIMSLCDKIGDIDLATILNDYELEISDKEYIKIIKENGIEKEIEQINKIDNVNLRKGLMKNLNRLIKKGNITHNSQK